VASKGRSIGDGKTIVWSLIAFILHPLPKAVAFVSTSPAKHAALKPIARRRKPGMVAQRDATIAFE
jgi:hypothetical protein